MASEAYKDTERAMVSALFASSPLPTVFNMDWPIVDPVYIPERDSSFMRFNPWMHVKMPTTPMLLQVTCCGCEDDFTPSGPKAEQAAVNWTRALRRGDRRRARYWERCHRRMLAAGR